MINFALNVRSRRPLAYALSESRASAMLASETRLGVVRHCHDRTLVSVRNVHMDVLKSGAWFLPIYLLLISLYNQASSVCVRSSKFSLATANDIPSSELVDDVLPSFVEEFKRRGLCLNRSPRRRTAIRIAGSFVSEDGMEPDVLRALYHT